MLQFLKLNQNRNFHYIFFLKFLNSFIKSINILPGDHLHNIDLQHKQPIFVSL